MITYGSKLRAIRALFGLTQEQVAERAKLERRDIVKFEQNVAFPTDQSKRAIEAALGLRLDTPEVEAAFSILRGGVDKTVMVGGDYHLGTGPGDVAE